MGRIVSANLLLLVVAQHMAFPPCRISFLLERATQLHAFPNVNCHSTIFPSLGQATSADQAGQIQSHLADSCHCEEHSDEAISIPGTGDCFAALAMTCGRCYQTTLRLSSLIRGPRVRLHFEAQRSHAPGVCAVGATGTPPAAFRVWIPDPCGCPNPRAGNGPLKIGFVLACSPFAMFSHNLFSAQTLGLILGTRKLALFCTNLHHGDTEVPRRHPGEPGAMNPQVSQIQANSIPQNL
jgi:hypothetical protein